MTLDLKHVVIVDDEPDLTQMLKEHFEQNGVTKVEQFQSAQAAYNYCVGLIGHTLHRLPQLIVTDISMPKMSGLELLQRIRGNDFLKTIPVIVMSAYGEEAKVREAIKAGAQDFIAKPFKFDFFNERVRSVLSRS